MVVAYKKTLLVKKINDNLSQRVYSYYIFKQYQFFIDNSNSKFIANATQEVEKFSYRVVECYIGLITEIFLVGGVLLFLFISYPYLSLVLFFLSISFFCVIYFFFKKTMQNQGSIKVHHDALKIDTLQKSFYIIQNIKLDNLENFFINKFKKDTEISSKSHFILSFWSDLPKPIIELFTLLVVTILIYTFYFHLGIAKEGILSILTIFGVAMFRILPSFNRIFGFLNMIKFHYSTTDIIRNIVKDKTFLKSIEPSVQEKYYNFNNAITIKNLSFKYDQSDQYVLNNINLSLKKNEIVGISGPSGSGKSTFLNLICSLLKPTTGNIFVDDHLLKNIYKSFQSKIGYVPQKIYLTDGSIIENIILAKSKDTYDYNKFREVIEICGLTNIINNLEKKEESLIGERGTRLSGGQQQKLGIARALYKKPDILILDEATNALDKESEAEILKLVLNLKNKITIIIVSHNKSVLDFCEKIYEIKNAQLNQLR